MRFFSQNYAKYEETLVAIVTNMAFSEFDKRTPKFLAKSLSIDEHEVLFCLENFKSIFRKSSKLSKSQNPFYALQIRFAQQWLKEEDEESEEAVKKPPLSMEHYQILVNYITSRAAAQRGNRIAIYVSVVAAIAAIVAAYIAISTKQCS